MGNDDDDVAGYPAHSRQDIIPPCWDYGYDDDEKLQLWEKHKSVEPFGINFKVDGIQDSVSRPSGMATRLAELTKIIVRWR